MTGNRGSRFDLSGSGAEPLEAEDPRAIGTIPLLGRLGSGGMGRVYLGVADGRYAAVKQVLPHLAEDENFRRHFGHELDNLSRLPAAASAPLLASDREARPPWFATAYIPGITLAQALVLNGGALPVGALWLLLREAAAGLRMVHALDMVHRDLKPSNVMLTPGGVSLIDFGIARAADQSRLTQSGVAVGTPAYMSPEQANATRKLTSATDIFALGSLIAYAATGQPPFGDGSGVGLLYQIVHGEPDLAALHAVDAALAETVAACLDKNPQARPTAERLQRLADDKSPSPAPGWPAPVLELLAQRSDFAATPPGRHGLHGPSPTAPNTTPDTAPGAAPASLRRQRRSRRLLLFVLPVVVAAAAALTVELLPQVTQAQTAGGAPTASAPGSSPSSAGSTASASAGGSPSSTASATTSPSATPSSSPGSTTHGAGSGGSTSVSSSKAATQPATATSTAPKATATATKTLGPRCVFTPTTSCSSNNPTVELRAEHNGDGGCTFTATTTWGDGTTTAADYPGSSSTYTVIATHRYAAKGSYSINITNVTDSGFCPALGGSATFTLTS